MTYRSLKTKYGVKNVEDKLEFQLVTNQPVYEALIQAIEALQAGDNLTGSVKAQAQQIEAASGLSDSSLAAFARKLKIVGRSNSLSDAKNALASLLVDLSATGDSIACARLGKPQALVREKAGDAGTDRKLIRRTDVLAALLTSAI